MEAKLAAEGVERSPASFPYSNWGPLAALLGFLLSLVAAALLGALFSPFGLGMQQLGLELALILVPLAIAVRYGATSFSEAMARLGVRGFRPSALKWVAATVGAYLAFAAVYTSIFGEPHQDDIADKLGAVPIQVLLIVIAAPIGEEVCFRGMLFGGLRERLPRISAALASGLIFGSLHAISGIEAVPPLIFFGFLLALLYEKTGSVVPGILLHVVNNCIALLGQ